MRCYGSGRIRQNSADLAEFGRNTDIRYLVSWWWKLVDMYRVLRGDPVTAWQNLAEFYDLAEYGRLRSRDWA